MQEFKNSNAFRYDRGSGGGSGSDFHGPGQDGASGSGFNQGGNNNQNNQSGQGGYNQQQQQQQSGYQSQPKQLNNGQYHVFTTSLDKRDRKLHKRAVNLLNRPYHVTYAGQSSLSCGAGRITRPGLIIRAS